MFGPLRNTPQGTFPRPYLCPLRNWRHVYRICLWIRRSSRIVVVRIVSLQTRPWHSCVLEGIVLADPNTAVLTGEDLGFPSKFERSVCNEHYCCRDTPDVAG